MGDVALVLKISPEEIETDLKAIQREIESGLPEEANLRGFQIKPVAFGLKVLLMSVVIPDAEGGADKIQRMIEEISGVGGAEVTDMTLI